MGMVKEFKDFIARGNVMDMAVGIIIGAAFGKIIASLVTDVIMPPIGLAMGGISFADMFIVLAGQGAPTLEAAKAAGAVTLNYGLFIDTLIQFLIIAFAVFMLVKWVNKLKKAAPPPLPDTKECPNCFTRIPIKAVKCPNCTSTLKDKAA